MKEPVKMQNPVWKGSKKEFDGFQAYLDLSAMRYITEGITDEMLQTAANKLVEELTVRQMNFIGEVWPDFFGYVSELLPAKMRAGIRRGHDILVVTSIYIIE